MRGGEGAARHQFQGLIVFGLGLALTTGALALLGRLAPDASRAVELARARRGERRSPPCCASSLFRSWVFRRAAVTAAATSPHLGDPGMTATLPSAPDPAAPTAPPPAAAPLRPRVDSRLAVLLVGTAALYLWNLAASGWANSFYAAAVQAGTQSWKAFFFGSLDAGNVDHRGQAARRRCG